MLAELKPWLRAKLLLVRQKSKLVEAIRYALWRWEGFRRFLDDGRIEIDSNMVERSIRPIALNRKNALFAGSGGGGDNWAVIASLIACRTLNSVDPYAYVASRPLKAVACEQRLRPDSSPVLSTALSACWATLSGIGQIARRELRGSAVAVDTSQFDRRGYVATEQAPDRGGHLPESTQWKPPRALGRRPTLSHFTDLLRESL